MHEDNQASNPSETETIEPLHNWALALNVRNKRRAHKNPASLTDGGDDDGGGDDGGGDDGGGDDGGGDDGGK